MIYKVVVVGAGGSGKTTLIQSLGEGKFYDETTMTIRGQAHLLKLFDESNNAMELQIYDLAGQEEFFEEERLRNLAADAAAAIVCFDIGDLDSLEEVEKWVSILPQGIPKVLVGTKIDLISEEETKITLEEDAQQYVEQFNFDGLYSTSAKDQKTLEMVLEALVALLSK
ncbi:MAG: GTP-binding protein [Promethearchaeota archaeon]